MKQIQRARIDFGAAFCLKYTNKIMMATYDSRMYFLDPKEKDE